MDFLLPFRHGSLLFLLILPAALLWWTWSKRGGGLVLPFDHTHPRKGKRIGIPVNASQSLPSFSLALVILLLAGPQRWDEPRSKKVLTNIEFCVDVSGSMNASFGEGTRYDASMVAINEFLDYRTGDAFGLTFFGNQVLHWVPLTTDISAFRCAPPFMKPRNLPYWFGGTEIGKALLACRRILLEREEGDRMIILISDGYSADLGGDRAAEITRMLREDGITVFAVHIASSEPPEPIVDITAGTGGEVFNPGDTEGLGRVFQAIDRMQETRIEKVQAEPVDDYPLWCWIALGVLAAFLLGSFGLRPTPW